MQPTKTAGPEQLRPLATREFDQIRRLAYDTFGLDLKDGKQELVSARLRRLVLANGLQNYQDYYRHVLEDRTGAELAAMIDALTTNHTSFLREPDHFRFLKDDVIPKLVDRKSIDIWCAACSTGEEVWTLLFFLEDALPGLRVRIDASDISNKALACARAGMYSAERVTGIPPRWYQKYLERGTGKWQGWYSVPAAWRSRVDFRRINLIEPFRWQRPFPVVFCRNVMIYFDRPTQQKVVASLFASLEPGGYLFIGHSESLTGVRHDFEYVRPAVYRKPPRGKL
jgi:chemotaxis protein methyltransferase CheR